MHGDQFVVLELMATIAGESDDPADCIIEMGWSEDRATIRGPACMGGINIKQYVLAQRPGFIFPMHRNPWVMKQPHREPLLALENADAMPAIENGQLAISDGAMDEQPVIPRPKAACR